MSAALPKYSAAGGTPASTLGGENVVSYLAKKDQAAYRRRLQKAYQQPDYPTVKGALMQIHNELKGLDRSAARSPMEGLEETLTLHRLGLFDELGVRSKTTNCIESLNIQLGKYLGRIKQWMDSDQRQRWVAKGLLKAEQRMRRSNHPEHLPLLKKALLKDIRTNNASAKEALALVNFN